MVELILYLMYKRLSINNALRLNRGALTGVFFQTIEPGHIIKQRRNFLFSPRNKIRLIEFLISNWSDEEKCLLVKCEEMSATVGEICVRLTENSLSECEALRSS